MKKKKMTLQEKQELNNEVKELVAYFCSLAEANKVEASKEDISSEQTTAKPRKYEIICNLLPSRLSSQNFLLKSNLTEEGEAVLEIYRMLQNGGMDAADKKVRETGLTVGTKISEKQSERVLSSDVTIVKHKHLEKDFSTLSSDQLLDTWKKEHSAGTLTEKDVVQLSEESSIEDDLKSSPTQVKPVFQVCKTRLRVKGLPTTGQVCQDSPNNDGEMMLEDDFYEFNDYEDKVLQAYNMWMKSYFGFHRKSVRNRVKERVIKIIKSINLDSDDDEKYFSSESSEGNGTFESSGKHLEEEEDDDDDESKIKDTFLDDEIHNDMLTLGKKIREERKPLAAFELRNRELEIISDDQSIETSSEESRINYDFTNDPPISFKELLENENTIMPCMELSINLLLDKAKHPAGSHELFYNMENLSAKKEEMRRKLLKDSEWQLDRGAFLSGVEYLKEDKDIEELVALTKDDAGNTPLDQIVKNMSKRDKAIVLQMECGTPIREAVKKTLTPAEQYRICKKFYHKYTKEIEKKAKKVRSWIRKMMAVRLNKLKQQKRNMELNRDSPKVCPYKKRGNTIKKIRKEIAMLRSFNKELQKKDTRSAKDVYREMVWACENFKERFDKSANDAEIVYTSHSEDDLELYKDDKRRGEISLPEMYEKLLHNAMQPQVTIGHDDSTIRKKIKRYSDLIRLRKRYMSIPTVKRYLKYSYIPAHLKAMLKQLKRRSLPGMNLEQTAYAMTISLDRVFNEEKLQAPKKRKGESLKKLTQDGSQNENREDLYAHSSSEKSHESQVYNDEMPIFLEDVDVNLNKLQIKSVKGKNLKLVKALIKSMDFGLEPDEKFTLRRESFLKKGNSDERINSTSMNELQVFEDILLLPIPDQKKESPKGLDPNLVLTSEFAACFRSKDMIEEAQLYEMKKLACLGTEDNGEQVIEHSDEVPKISPKLNEDEKLSSLSKEKYSPREIQMRPRLKHYLRLLQLQKIMNNFTKKYEDTAVKGKFLTILPLEKLERFKMIHSLFVEPKELFWMEDELEDFKPECQLTPTSQAEAEAEGNTSDESGLHSEDTSKNAEEPLEELVIQKEVKTDSVKEAVKEKLEDAHEVKVTTIEESQEIQLRNKEFERPKAKCGTISHQDMNSECTLHVFMKRSYRLRSKHWGHPQRKFLESFLCRRNFLANGEKDKKPCYGLLKSDKKFYTADVILYKMLKLMKKPFTKFFKNEAFLPYLEDSEKSTDSEEEVLRFFGKSSPKEITWDDIEKNFIKEFVAIRHYLLGKQEMFVSEKGCKDEQTHDVRQFLYQDLLRRVPRKKEQNCPTEKFILPRFKFSFSMKIRSPQDLAPAQYLQGKH
ncbi:uncharacterized protein isoform X3 [Rhodnius prolixus]|uniref:uncharacterized protein isoform X3 n=1 Tax=Rhodnius prolixus TaxID=13249 RepID=UPI003D18CAAC